MTQQSTESYHEQRAAARHRTDFQAIFQRMDKGEFEGKIVNISAHGFMLQGDHDLQRGDRVIVRLPVVGLIEGHMVWSLDNRAGFQFERIVRMPDFLDMLKHMAA